MKSTQRINSTGSALRVAALLGPSAGALIQRGARAALLAAAVLAGLALWPTAAAAGEPVEPVWSADMTVVEYTSVSIGASSADLFSNVGGSGGLRIRSLWSHVPDRDLRLAFEAGVPNAADYTLQAGGLSLEFPAGSSGDSSFKWNDVDVRWEVGQVVHVRIVLTAESDAQQANTPATGVPTVSGTARVGETLTADTSGIADADGLSNVSFAYQWIRADGGTDADIADATGFTYTLTGDDLGKAVKLKVTFNDDQGNRETLTVVAAAEVAESEQKPQFLVGNLGVNVASGIMRPLNAARSGFAQAFTTGAKSGGYALGSVGIHVSHFFDESTVGDHLRVTLNGVGSEGEPGDALCTLTSPSSLPTPGVLAFEAPAGGSSCPQLAAETTYFVVIEWVNPSGTGAFALIPQTYPTEETAATEEDPGGAEGWSIADQAYYLSAGSSARTWTAYDETASFKVQVKEAALSATRVNSPATGLPTTSGTAQVGETLTTDTSGIADEDGLENTTFSYQWIAGDTDIDGGNDSTYTLTASEERETIRVRVTFTDDAGHEETLTSEPTGEVAAKPNTPATGAPTISGTAQVGETLTADTSGIADEDGLENAAFAYQWIRSDGDADTDIEGATGPTYEPTEDDAGKVVKVRATFTDDAGNEESLTSEATAAIAARPNTPATGAPTIGGTAQVGETLTADTSGIADEDGLENAAFAYQWVADDADIQGATSSTYTLADSEEGKTVKVRASFTDDAGHEETLTSEPTGEVAARPNTPATGAPTISGTAQVGETLTADVSGIADEDSLDNAAFAYQWVADDGDADTDIEGATGPTYEPTEDDVGKTVKVRATFTDDAGYEESLTSAATAAVTYAAGPPGAPREVGVQVGDSELQVTWQAPADENKAPVERYRIRYGEEGGSSQEVHTTLTTHTLGNLTNGVAYMVQVTAENAAGYGPASAEMSTTPQAEVTTEPDTPQNLTGKAVYHRRVSLDWDDVFGADSYEVQFYDWDVRALVVLPHGDVTVAFSGSSAVADQLTGTSFWWLQVRAVNAAGVSEWSKMVQILATKESDWETEEANNPATGLPVITGTAQVGETLTADVSDIADADGLENAAFTYQWTADDADIDGAANSTYTLADDDAGQTLKVRVSFTDDAGNEENLTSEPTAAVADKPNTPATGQPAITGTAQVGETLTADTSGIADADGLDNAVFGYQWLADGTAIDGATNPTYTLTDDDAGQTLKVRVGFTDDAGNEETLTSEPAAEVAAKPNTPATGLPAISGTAQVGETLTADVSGIADEDGLDNAAFSYQWTADDADIDGATTPTYTLTDAAAGQTLKVTVSFTDDAGNEETLTSEPTAAVAAAPLALTVSLENAATTHNGADEFTFEIRFSEEVKLSYKTLRDHAFTVTGGTILRAQRMDKPSNILWRITVRPDGNGDVVIELPATTDCNAQGAICAKDGSGRKLSNPLSFTVSGPGQ